MITKEFALIVLDEFEKDSHFKRAIQSASEKTGIKLKCHWEELWVSSGTIGGVRTLGVANDNPCLFCRGLFSILLRAYAENRKYFW